MLRGKLFYDKEDVNRNKTYIDWLIEEATSQGLRLDLAILGQDKLEPCDFVINRSRNYELALKYELNGIRVFNNSKFTLVGNNKLSAYRFVSELGIDHARIYLDEPFENLPSKLIRKPNTGHGGQDISLIESSEKFSEGHLGVGFSMSSKYSINSDHSISKEHPINTEHSVSTEQSVSTEHKHENFNSYIYQQYIENNLGDVRYYIINNQIVHSIIRTPQKGQIVSNFSKGGNINLYTPSKKEEKLIETILSNIHMDFGGIDFIVTRDDRYLFNEFEDVVGSRMLSTLGVNDTTYLYIKHIKEAL